MKKNRLLLTICPILVLSSCKVGVVEKESESQSSESIQSSVESNENKSSDSSGKIVNPENAKFKLVMNGEIYPNQFRSIYAILNEGVTGTVKFESSNTDVLHVSEIEGVTNEALITAMGEGSATISAYLEGEENILVTKEVTIAHGTAMPDATFAKLQGSMKVTMEEKYYDYDEHLNPTLVGQDDIVTIYEEVEDATNYHGTDAYQIDVKNHTTGKSTFSQKFVRNGVRLAVEQLTKDNTVTKITQYDEDGEEYNWVNSYYENLFYYDKDDEDANPTVTAADFETYDNGKSYVYTGSSIWATTYLTVSFVMSNITPDEFKITVDGDNIGFEITVDPYAEDGETKGGQVITGEASEIGTATIDHLEPYAHETYHDGLETARAEMENAKNYTTVYTLTDDEGTTTYTLTYTEDTVEEKIVAPDGTITHDGAHKNGTGYFTYEYDDATGKLTKTKDYEADFNAVDRYPTFDFAVEVLGEGVNDVYSSRGDTTGGFISYCLAMPKYIYYYYAVDGATKVTMKDGHFTKMEATLYSSTLADEIQFSGTISNLGTTTLNYDWDSIITPAEPEAYPDILLASLQEWGVDELIPYLYPTNVGYENYVVSRYHWRDSSGTMDSTYAKLASFKTNKFETDELRDAYIESYKALLIENGWTLTEEVDDNLGYTYYSSPDDTYKLSVGAYKYYSGGSATKAVVFTFTNAAEKLTVPSSYFADD